MLFYLCFFPVMSIQLFHEKTLKLKSSGEFPISGNCFEQICDNGCEAGEIIFVLSLTLVIISYLVSLALLM